MCQIKCKYFCNEDHLQDITIFIIMCNGGLEDSIEDPSRHEFYCNPIIEDVSYFIKLCGLPSDYNRHEILCILECVIGKEFLENAST